MHEEPKSLSSQGEDGPEDAIGGNRHSFLRAVSGRLPLPPAGW